MATRNIVPRANGEGGIGTSAKHWGAGHFDTLPNWQEYLAESNGYGIVSGCTPTISGLTVTVAAGVVHLAGGTRKEIPSTNITLDAADSTNPRIDLVYIDSTGTVAKVTGTAAASPSAPALPTGGISVCNIKIAAGETTGTLIDLRFTKNVVNVDKLGFVKYNTLDEAMNSNGNINVSLWEKYVADGTITKGSVVEFGAGFYPFSSPIYLPNNQFNINLGNKRYYQGYNISGVGSTSVLVFPASKGFIAQHDADYYNALICDLTIMSKKECMDFYNDDNPCYYIRDSHFERLHLYSEDSDCIYCLPGVYHHSDGTNDVLQYNNYFEYCSFKAPNGAGVSGFYAVFNVFRANNDVMGQCKYIYKNCGGRFTEHNLAFNRPEWILYWDYTGESINLKLDFSFNNFENTVLGFVYIPNGPFVHELILDNTIVTISRDTVTRNKHPFTIADLYGLSVSDYLITAYGSSLADKYPNLHIDSQIYVTGQFKVPEGGVRVNGDPINVYEQYRDTTYTFNAFNEGKANAELSTFRADIPLLTKFAYYYNNWKTDDIYTFDKKGLFLVVISSGSLTSDKQKYCAYIVNTGMDSGNALLTLIGNNGYTLSASNNVITLVGRTYTATRWKIWNIGGWLL